MANRTLRVLLKKIYTDGSIDTIYLKSRASDVFLDGSSTDTLASIVTKVNGIQEGATAVSSNATNGYISINGTATQVYAHPNSGVTAGTYNSVTVNAAGHVTAGTSNSYLLSSSKVTFTTASTKANIVSNSDTIAVMLGKLAKWYSSFGSLAWLSSVGTSQLDTTLSTAYNQRVVTGTANTTASVTESREITAAGYVADARAVANLQTQINTINSSAIKNITRNGTTFTATRLNNGTFTFTQQDNNTTYANYKGATTAASGTAGLVPAASTANRLYFLRGDGGWQVPTNTTYGAATGSALGLVKTGNNITNSSGTISLTKANVTAALGYTPPTTNTTYDLSYTTGAGTINSTYCTGSVGFCKQKCNGKFITSISFDISFKGSYSSDGVAIIASGIPAPAHSPSGCTFVCSGNAQNDTSGFGTCIITSDGKLMPHYCGIVKSHWWGSYTYVSN